MKKVEMKKISAGSHVKKSRGSKRARGKSFGGKGLGKSASAIK